jgi:hypothetical protein
MENKIHVPNHQPASKYAALTLEELGIQRERFVSCNQCIMGVHRVLAPQPQRSHPDGVDGESPEKCLALIVGGTSGKGILKLENRTRFSLGKC